MWLAGGRAQYCKRIKIKYLGGEVHHEPKGNNRLCARVL